MFDIGFWEIILLCVITLIVVGPERLPRLVRTAGLWISKARRLVAEVRAEVERELRIEELKQSINQQGNLDEFKQLAERVKAINSDLKDVESDLKGQPPAPARLADTESPRLPKTPVNPPQPSSSDEPSNK